MQGWGSKGAELDGERASVCFSVSAAAHGVKTSSSALYKLLLINLLFLGLDDNAAST